MPLPLMEGINLGKKALSVAQANGRSVNSLNILGGRDQMTIRPRLRAQATAWVVLIDPNLKRALST